MTRANIEGIEFSLLSWKDLDEMTRQLAAQVLESGQQFDRIVAVANGGLTMARHFGDLIDLRKISMLQTAFYVDVNETNREPTVLQPLSIDITRERLLVFEDIVDTGTTLEFVLRLLMDQQGAASVAVAALLQKSWASVKPEFVAKELDAWVIYPYETRETIQTLQSKWQKSGRTLEEVADRLDQIGFSQTDIANFLR